MGAKNSWWKKYTVYQFYPVHIFIHRTGFGITFDRRSGVERRYDIDRRKGPDRRGNKKPDKKVLTDHFFPLKSASELANSIPTILI